jgi:hypothetical protein
LLHATNLLSRFGTLRPTAFDHDDYIFELKTDGFRSLT